MGLKETNKNQSLILLNTIPLRLNRPPIDIISQTGDLSNEIMNDIKIDDKSIYNIMT